MEKTEYNVWLERFSREISIKSAVILFGNTADIMLNSMDNGVYQSVMHTVISAIKNKGYEKIIKWDRCDGIDHEISDNITYVSPQESTPAVSEGSSLFDMGIPQSNNAQDPTYKDMDEFFKYMLNVIRDGTGNTAFILDYSDYVFGNAASLSEHERECLTALGKALRQAQSYNLLSDDFEEPGNIIVLFAQNNSMIPPAFYLNNPYVSSVNVPLPGRTERKKFIEDNLKILRISQDLERDNTLKADFIDALDGFTLCEIAQLMKLSRQKETERFSFEKLINLFKYGEKTSPWEELSKEKLMNIEARLGERVKGQDQAISKVKDVIIRAYTGFSGLQHSSKQRKPKGTLFFVGPTGVGKTELAKALAEFVFGDENACIRFDMSEYNHEHSDQRLVGAPPGYVGFEAGGQLTNAIKERPFCVLLFDEIEKAHGKILDKFLQILEDGRLTDGKGETVSFSESIIIFTSNIGAAKVNADLSQKEARKEFTEAVRKHFVDNLGRPELLNRIGDNIVAFNFINDPAVFTQIARSKFRGIEDFVKERYKADIEFKNEEAAFMAIANQAGKQNGGRGLLNVMESAIVNPMSEFIFERSEMLTNRKIIISPLNEKRPDLAEFEFELK